MSRNYKFHNPDGLYFVSFTHAFLFVFLVFVQPLRSSAVVEWLDACLSADRCLPEMSIKTYLLKVCLIAKNIKEWRFLLGA